MKDIKGPHCNHHAQQKMCDLAGDPDLVVVPQLCVVCVDEADTLRAQLAAVTAERDKAVSLAEVRQRDVEMAWADCHDGTCNACAKCCDAAIAQLAAEKARAEKAEAAYAKASRERAEAWDDVRAAERSRDELGFQLAACQERLRLAMAVVEAARALPPYRANMSHLAVVRGKITALDAVPGDALATATPTHDPSLPWGPYWRGTSTDIGPALDRAHEASGVVTNGAKGVE